MYLSPVQQEVLELLREFGGLRGDQVQALMDMRHQKKVRGISAMLRQLVLHHMAGQQDDIFTAEGRAASNDTLAAIDIMLQLPGTVQSFLPGKQPFALTFFREKKNILYRYDICPVPPGKELVISAQLEQMNPRYRIIIFLLCDLKQREYLTAPCQYRFAVLQDKTYYFYEEN